jgi:hypothetical protein
MQNPGDLVFVHGQGLFSWLVAKAQGYVSPDMPSHVCMVGEDGMTLHTTMTGGLKMVYGEENAVTYLRGEKARVFSLNSITPDQRLKILQKSRMMFGEGYDWAEIATLALGHWPTISPKQKRVICSVSCDLAYAFAGINLFKQVENTLWAGTRNRGNDCLTPAELYQVCCYSNLWEEVTPTWKAMTHV